MPNTFAYAFLAVWPIVCFVLFRRLPLERAVIWSLLASYLLLPPETRIDLPLFPPLDKVTLPNLAAFVICTVFLGHKVPLIPASRVAAVLVVVFVLSSVPTVLSNGDPLFFRVGGLPGLRFQDILSATGTQVMILMPFFLGRALLSSEAAIRDVLIAFAIGGLVYSVPALVEVFIGPQINIWIYGFFQHDLLQMMRYGGYRPIVFLPHGIWLAFFMMVAVISLAVLLKQSKGPRAKLVLFLAYLAAVLIMCKTLSAIAYAALALPLVLFFKPSIQLRIAVILAGLALVYPLLRGGGLVPVEGLLAQIQAFDVERAASLGFRLENEEMLLAHANERALFGWGGWGRNYVHDYFSGERLGIADGRWIIVFGVYGWVGFLAEFGLLALPILLLWRRAKNTGGNQVSPYAAAAALILGLNMFDLLPNATLIPLTWLLAGTVLGYAEKLSVPQRQPERHNREMSATAPTVKPPRTII